MGGGLAIAWLAGQGLIVWRSASEQHLPPSPRQLLVASGLFVALAVVAEYQPARAAATAFGFAVDLAILLKVLPGSGTSSSITKNTAASGWASIANAGNTVVIPNGTAASEVTASASGSSSPATAASGDTSQAVQQYAGQFGWSSSDITDWNNVIAAESGGNPAATNPSSGAYGIAQALGHGNANTACPKTGVNQYGGYGLTDAQAQQANCGSPVYQLLWMANYIKATYGTPAAAWAHEQSASYY